MCTIYYVSLWCHWQNALQCWIEWQRYYINSYVQRFLFRTIFQRLSSVSISYYLSTITLIVRFLANFERKANFVYSVPNIALHFTLTVYNLNIIQISLDYVLLRNKVVRNKWKCPYSSLCFCFYFLQSSYKSWLQHFLSVFSHSRFVYLL